MPCHGGASLARREAQDAMPVHARQGQLFVALESGRTLTLQIREEHCIVGEESARDEDTYFAPQLAQAQSASMLQLPACTLRQLIFQASGVPPTLQALTCRGRSVGEEGAVLVPPIGHPGPSAATVRLAVRLPGGKGGFGSLLRALGSKKSGKETDNIDACRNLDGRRIRHVQDEKKWVVVVCDW